MMKLKLISNNDEIKPGFAILSRRLNYEVSDGGFEITAVNRPGNLNITKTGSKIRVEYEKKIHFFRALGIIAESATDDINITETPVFTSNGVMIDASRNAVMKPQKIKELIEIMAIMGLNLIMMYTEDTYEVKKYPYFGYMRGRYTEEELRECDDYADIFGIEMMPCIQTLAHLEQALKWNMNIDITDTKSVILVDSEDTYGFIRAIMAAAAKPFRTRRIHLGMDEAGDLGLGVYLERYGYKNPNVLIKNHFNRVEKIAEELGLSPVIWADMYFKLCSKNNCYYDYDIEFDEKTIKSVPPKLGLVYWDYDNDNETEYGIMMKNHKKLSENVMYAGGLHTWESMTVHNRVTIRNTVSALSACVKNGIKEVFATAWGDNGNRVNFFEALFGLQLYAEIGYGHEYSEEEFKRRFYACTGESADAFLNLDMLDDLGQSNITANPSEYLLWQDILTGLADKHITVDNVSDIYASYTQIFARQKEKSKNYGKIFDYSEKLAAVLELKADAGVRLKKYYDSHNRNELVKFSNETLPELKSRINKLKESFCSLWLDTYKVFGLEVMDMRFGALIERVDFAKRRTDMYLNGEIAKIEELEEERLYYLANDWYKCTDNDLNLKTIPNMRYTSASCVN